MTRTALVTGASGYIAKHIIVRLLDAGYQVRGSVRSLDRQQEVRAAIAPALANASDLSARLTFVVLDLTRDMGWTDALRGMDALVHTASPFPMTQPKDERQAIGPAVDGTLRALRAAKATKVNRVVLTSSVVAIAGRSPHPEGAPFTEADWTDVTHSTATPYAKSKTLAEQDAWAFVAEEAPDIRLTTINPGLVVGPALDTFYGTSMQVIERLLKGSDPLLPRVGFPLVDVRDVAEMHLRALQRPETAGKRYAASAGTMSSAEIAKVLKTAHPDRKIPTRVAPDLVIRLLALFDPTIRTLVPALGRLDRVSNARAVADMEMTFRPPALSLREAADWLIGQNRV